MHWILKLLLIVFLLILFLSGIEKELNNKSETVGKKIINIIEIITSVVLIYFIYKI